MLRTSIVAAALWLGATPLFAQNRPLPQGDIVVTAERLSDLEAALAACRARKCPPDQEIAAALKVAENQFVDGAYAGARGTLLASIARNKRYSKQYPVAVAGLLRANSRIAAHLGDGDSYRIGALDSVSALKAGLPDSDPRVFGGEIEVGDMWARVGRYSVAIDQYRAVGKRAAKLGLINVEGLARLRLIMLYGALATEFPDTYTKLARDTADALFNDADIRLKPYANAARIMIARLDAKHGDQTAVDRMIADYRSRNRAENGNQPVLLYAPTITPFSANPLDDDQSGLLSQSMTARLGRQNYDGEWVDIGFWITPEGRVIDADVLRSGKRGDTPAWAKPVLVAISGRRYAPLTMDPSLPGLMRVERYTLTAERTTQTGSRLYTRETTPRIEMLDLSVDPAGPAAR